MISQQDMKVLDIYFQRRHAIALDQEKVLKTIARSCTIHDSQQLLEDLNKNFLIKFNVIKGKDCILMLKDVISKNMIELNFHAENWEEAVEEAGKLLMRGGCIDKEYIESMVNTVRTMGSYIVIAPGIALPHSRSGEHAHKVGISFLRLAEPVKFGHPENDPVDLIFGLSSIDNKSHLNALKDLSKILEEENNVEYLRQAKSTEQILNFLSSEGGVW
jgi:mannitol operon transcriptional antiterminator